MPYPEEFDTIQDPATTLVGHSAIHAETDGAIVRTQQTLGLSPQGDKSSVAARLNQIESDVDDGVPDGSVSYTKIDQARIWIPLHHGWQSYTPTLTFLSLGASGTSEGRYLRVGALVHFSIRLELKAGATFSGTPVQVSLPPGLQPLETITAAAWVLEGGTRHHPLVAVNADTPSKLQFIVAPDDSAGAGQMGRTGASGAHVFTPFTPGTFNDDILVVSGSYECAQPAADRLA